MRRTTMIAIALLVGGLALTGCADQAGDSPTTSDEQSTTTPAPSASTDDVTEEPAELALEPGAHQVDLPASLEVTTIPGEATAGVAWTGSGDLVYVIAFGSSTCPWTAEPTAAAEDDGVLAVTFEPLPDGACTMDYRPATTVVELPSGSGDAGPVTVRVGDWGTVELPERTDGEPSAVVWAAAAELQ